jgi:two-component system NarL family sensor kinase
MYDRTIDMSEVSMHQQEVLKARQAFPFRAHDAGRSAAYLRALLENSPIATVVLDAQHFFTMCNPAFERLFQYTPKQLVSATLDELIAAPEQAVEAAQLTRQVLQGDKVHTLAQRRRRDGMIVDVEIYGIPLMIEDELTGVCALYQDVTERNKVKHAFREMSDQLENLQVEERRRLARDLHDSTSQELAVLNWNLSRLMGLVENGDAQLVKLVRETRNLASQCSARIRSAAYLMHPPLLGSAGLTTALTWMVEGFEDRSGIEVCLEIHPELGRLRDEIEIAIYRLVQEGLANILRHSGSADARIVLWRRGKLLELTISDTGRNHSCESIHRSYNSSSGVGLSGMRERLEGLGGSFKVECSQLGTRLTATVPLEGESHA